MATLRSEVHSAACPGEMRLCGAVRRAMENIADGLDAVSIIGLFVAYKIVYGVLRVDGMQKMSIFNVPFSMKFATTLLFLITTVTAWNNPQVHEDNFDQNNNNFRRPRVHRPPVFNYYNARQQDQLVSRYAQQQKSDMANMQRTGRMVLDNHYNTVVKPYNNPISMSFEESESDWTPMKAGLEKNRTSLFDDLNMNSFENDLDAEGSEIVEQKQPTSRADTKGNYIYVHPNILRQNFGLDSKETQTILKNTALNYKDKVQLSDLRDLIGKNPNVQLEGLQRLLNQKDSVDIKQPPTPFQKEQTSATSQQNTKLAYNPQQDKSLQQLQIQLDEVAKQQAQEVLAKAKNSALAYVEAQHKAIALAQAKAKERALAVAAQQAAQQAVIAQHNQQNYQTAVPAQTAQLHAPVYRPNPTPNAQYNLHTPTQIANQQRQVPNYANQHQQQVPLNQILQQNKIAAQLHQQVAQSSVPHQYAAGHQQLQLVQPQSNAAASYAHAQLQPHIHNNQIDEQITSSQASYGHSHVLQQASGHAVVPTYSYEAAKQAVSVETDELAEEDGNALGHQENSSPEEEKQSKELVAESAKPAAQVYQEYILENADETVKKLEGDEAESNHDDLQYAAKYAFGYRILDHHQGNDFGHEEKRNGENAKGHYHVLLPDGRRQTVEYYADNSGYHARVTYQQGEPASA